MVNAEAGKDQGCGRSFPGHSHDIANLSSMWRKASIILGNGIRCGEIQRVCMYPKTGQKHAIPLSRSVDCPEKLDIPVGSRPCSGHSVTNFKLCTTCPSA